MDPRIQARVRIAFLERWMPSWANRASCAGRDTSDWFRDDVADSPEPRFPEGVYRAMKTCYSCPVRTLCLEYAFEQERGLDAQQWWSGEPIEERRRFGVLGGIPGRLREHYAEHPNRIGALEDWLEDVALERHWTLPNGRKSTQQTA